MRWSGQDFLPPGCNPARYLPGASWPSCSIYGFRTRKAMSVTCWLVPKKTITQTRTSNYMRLLGSRFHGLAERGPSNFLPTVCQLWHLYKIWSIELKKKCAKIGLFDFQRISQVLSKFLCRFCSKIYWGSPFIIRWVKTPLLNKLFCLQFVPFPPNIRQYATFPAI